MADTTATKMVLVTVSFRLLTCPIMSAFSLSQMFVFLSVYVMLNILILMFVRLLVCSLPDWRGPAFPRRMSLLVVCMSYKKSKVIFEDLVVQDTQPCLV